MDISSYDVMSNGLLALIGCYTFFVFIHTYCWTYRKPDHTAMLILYWAISLCIQLGRRFALQNYLSAVPYITTLEPLFILLDFVLLRLFFKIKSWMALLLILFFRILHIATHITTETVMLHLFPQTLSAGFPFFARHMHEMTLMAVAVLAQYLCVLLISIARRAKLQPRFAWTSAVIMLLPTILFGTGEFIAYPLMGNIVNYQAAIIIGFLLFSVNVIAWLFVMDADRKNTQHFYVTQHYAEQKQYYSRIIENHKNIDRLAHDEKKHYNQILWYVEKKDYVKLREYIISLGGSLNHISEYVITGNQDIDMVLNAKISEAEAVGCCVTVEGRLPGKLPLDPVDSCMIFGNCLDNAMNACLKTDKQNISIELSYHAPFLLIIMKNSCPPVETKVKQVKAAKSANGMGLGIITATAQKYNGNMTYCYEANMFQIEILLQLSILEEEM
ncbi:MAG: ATP-binding protein [Oscillospiraceae bacterium]|nr:ATP-binding protein [Oscillospiraceae bacterium]